MHRGCVQPSGRYHSSEFLFPTLLAVLFAVGMCAAHLLVLPVSDAILPWQRELYPTVNTLPGKLVYGALVASLGFCSAWRLFRASHRNVGAMFSWMLVLCVTLAFTIGNPVSPPFAIGFWATLTAWLYLGRDRCRVVSSCKLLGKAFFRPAAVVVVGLFAVFCLILPLKTPVVASSGAQLASLNNHYSGFMPGFDLVRGDSAMPIGVLNYGLGPALLVGGFYQLFSPITPDLVRLSLPIKFYQFVALLIVALALHTLNRKHWFPLFAVVLASTPTFSSVSDAIYYPNLSGIRYLSVFFVILLLARSASAGVLGIASALSLLYAVETGVVASIGAFTFLVVFSYVAGMGLKSLVRPLSRYLLGTCSLLPGIYLFGTSQSRGQGAASSSFLLDFASGFCGISTLPSPFSILIFLFASCAVYRGFSRAGRGCAHRIDAYQAAVGSMMLVWLFYYINRMHPYNLWVQSAFLVMLFAPRVSLSLARLLRQGSIFAQSFVVLSTALLVAVSVEHVTTSVRDVREWHSRVLAVQGLSGNVTDLSVPDPLHAGVIAQIDALRGISDKNEYLVVSSLSTDVRALGFNQGVPWYDLFADILTRSTLDRARDWIELHGPRFILLDDPSGTIAQDANPQTAQLQALVGGLSSYREVAKRDGWITFERSGT